MRSKKISISVFQIFITLLIVIGITIAVMIIKKNANFGNALISKKLGSFTGNGTVETPYKIETIEDLVNLSKDVNNGKTYSNQYFELTNKLDFQEDSSYSNANGKYGDFNRDGKVESIKVELTTGKGFPTIGNSEDKPFEGIFKGNDNTINNLLINVNSEYEYAFVGLFGNNKGKILNIKLSGKISVEDNLENKEIHLGMLNARNQGLIQACNVEGEIYAISNGDNMTVEVAGIAAENMGKIVDSASKVNIIANQTKAGIVAKNVVSPDIENSGEIINCTNEGNIKETTGSNYYTAGVIAENQQGNITSCNNNGRIEGRKAGGIAGISTGYIVACQNTGSISNVKEDSNDAETVGGIVGVLDTATVENCKNTGDISGINDIGGIAGENKGTISQSRNEGSVSKISSTIGKTINIGGLVGKNTPTSRLTNSKNYGKVTSETDTLVNLGGICGTIYNDSIVELCESNGVLYGSAKIINPNEDVSIRCASCISNNGGNAETADFGELNIGIIYGKFEEK